MKLELAYPTSSLPREVRLLLGAASINFFGYMALPFMALYLTSARGASLDVAGSLLTAYAAGNVVGAWFGGRVCDGIGLRLAFSGSLLLSALFLFLLPLHTGQSWLLYVHLFALAVAQGAFRPIYDSCIVHICPEAERATAYAWYVFVINVAAAIGTSVGGWAFSLKPTAIFYLNSVSCLAAAAWILFFFRDASADALSKRDQARVMTPTGDPSGRASSPLSDARFLAVCATVIVVEALGKQSSTTMPLFMTQDLGLAVEQFGRILTTGHLLFAVLVVPLTRMVKARSPTAVSMLGCLIIAGSFLSLAQISTATLATCLYISLLFGQLLFYPAIVAITMDIASRDSNRSGAYMGIYRSAQALAGILAPMVGMFVLAKTNAATLWLACSALALCAIGPIIIQHWSVRRVRADLTRKQS